jgi:uncharacterized lipoprotein YehR (DUF1307 family)
VFEEKPVIACYAKGVQVTKQSSVPNHIKGFTSIHKSHQKLDGNKIFQTQSTNYKEYDKVEYGHQQPIKYL